MRTTDARALRISRTIHEMEDEIDRLIGKTGALLMDVTEVRIGLNMDACEGQRPLQRLVDMQGRLAEARSKVVGAHSDLKRIAETRADVPIGCPDKQMGYLREVDAA